MMCRANDEPGAWRVRGNGTGGAASSVWVRRFPRRGMDQRQSSGRPGRRPRRRHPPRLAAAIRPHPVHRQHARPHRVALPRRRPGHPRAAPNPRTGRRPPAGTSGLGPGHRSELILAARTDPTSRAALRDGRRELPWALAHRRVIPPDVRGACARSGQPDARLPSEAARRRRVATPPTARVPDPGRRLAAATPAASESRRRSAAGPGPLARSPCPGGN